MPGGGRFFDLVPLGMAGPLLKEPDGPGEPDRLQPIRDEEAMAMNMGTLPMTEASRWRFSLGERVGRAYAADPNVRVVMVAGSTGRGTADRYADLEIDVYWREPPTDAERRAAVERSGGTLLLLAPYQDDEWEEQIAFGGFGMHTSTFLVSTMERYLREVLEDNSTAVDPQMRLSSLLHGQTLVGEDLVARWRERAAAYPAGLAAAMVREHLAFDRFGHAAAVFAARDDLLPLYDLLCDTERQILGVLLGLNRLYRPTPTFKHTAELVAEMRVTPPDLDRRLKAVFRLAPPAAVAALHTLCEEVLALVEVHLPEVPTTPARAGLAHQRGVWDQPPPV
jgi:hypothetical protein